MRKRVHAQALIEVRGCLRDCDDGREAAREAKAVAETIISPEYEGRVLIELLQNAHDAHPARSTDGRIEFMLDEDEGEHGTLYVANSGRPFGGKDFKALCSIALSSKRADTGIGHKGVGFKSVLHLCDAPEVYSVAREGVRVLDGFTFRFARLDDYDALAREVSPERPGFAAYLRENLLTLKVPVFVEDVPEAAQRFARRGFVTVVRLPLKSADARSAAEAQLRELMDDEAPFELFLDRLERVGLIWRSAGKTQRRTYDRQVEELHNSRDLKVQQVTLRRRLRLIVVSGKADAGRAREAIATSVEKGVMRRDWTVWEKKAEVRVAIPVEDPLSVGRLYTFLPMGEQIPAPVPAYVHAPFFAEMNRRSFNESVPWNDLLLDTVAELCARAVLATTDGRAPIPHGAVVDLMCWQPPALSRLTSAFWGLNQSVAHVPFIPAVGPASGTRTSLHRAFLWAGERGATAFTPKEVAANGVTDLIDARLHPVRLDRLMALARAVGTRLEPPIERLTFWAEWLAEAAAHGPFDSGWWADFYYDLSQTFPDGTALTGKRIILNSRSGTAPAGGEGVFFDRETLRDGSLPPLPDELLDRLHFVHEGIAWSGKGRKRRAHGRKWLRTTNLVHDYGADRVLDVVAAALRTDDVGGAVRLACLRYACAVSHTLKNQGRRVPVLKGLRVPTRSGWTDAGRAMFGPGWPGEHSSVDDTLTRFLEGVRHLSTVLTQTEGLLLSSPEELCGDVVSVAAMSQFLERHQVTHGLRPRYESSSAKVRGETLNRPTRFWFPGRHSLLPHWRSTAERWPNRDQVYYSSVDYHPRNFTMAVLPGQDDYAAFAEEDRRLYAELIVYGLAVTWPDTALEMRFVRHSDPVGTPWPTPLSAFLGHAPWIPQTAVPGTAAEGTAFAPAATAWWWQGAQSPPLFLAVAPATLRGRRSTRLTARLRLLGVRSWDDPGTAFDRLQHLPDLVRADARLREGRLAHEVGLEYEKAWARLLPREAHARDMPAVPGTAPRRLLVTRADVLEALDLTDTEETVYVPDPDGAQNQALLARVPVPLLPIRDRALGGRVHTFLDRRTPFGIQRCGDAEHGIQADGVPVEDAPHLPLTRYAGPWLRALAAALVEFDDQRASRPEPLTVAEVDDLLRRCDVTVADEAVIWIAGHRLAEQSTEHALLHSDPDRPRIVVVHGRPRPLWRVLRTAAPALASLIRAPHLADALWAALTRLEERGRDTDLVPDEDLAAVLNLRPHQLQAVRAERASQRSGSAPLVPLIAGLDLDLAEELRRCAEEFPDRAALTAWLAGRIGTPGADLFMRLLDDDDRERQLTSLSVSLADANRAWRVLGLPEIDNRDRHERQFATWLQRNRPALATRVRDAYAGVYRIGGSLAEYVKLRDFSALAPDPDWHTTMWHLADDFLQAHADVWLAARLPTPPSASRPLRPLAEVREASSAVIHRQVQRLRQLTDEWQRLNPPIGRVECPSAQDMQRGLDDDGLLDFDVLTVKMLITWLSAHGHWPENMPLSDRRVDLGLAATRPSTLTTGGAGAASGGGPSGSPPGPHIVLNGKSVSARADDLPALARKVAADITPEQRATSATSAAALTPRIPRPRASTSGPGPQNGGSYLVPVTDQDRTLSVGLAGEAVVAEWLHEQFGVKSEDSWKSGLRMHGLAGAQPGDDRLGYDFLIHDGDVTYLYEVKASIGNSAEFDLSASEVRRASRLKPDETYFIVYVSYVFDRSRRVITVLPNPFAAPDLAGYQLISTQMRLRFNLE
ncbi:sacsin N-terminal ATP-binding-like domain-containing protein [Streptomyces niveus]|uniref:sacsin N-terminal ATP-binding-like domain-containing protein n=1 Tax=Streptomyces niveus TaxID=193462 RepID=UPI0036786B7A